MRRESPDELTRLVVTALAVFIGGTAALVANDTIRAYNSIRVTRSRPRV